MQNLVSPFKALTASSEPYVERSPVANLESVPDDLDDTTHARLDEAVFRVADDEPSIPSLAAFLLATIVSTSEGKLDPQYEKTPKAKVLIDEHPELMDKLKEAWLAKSFKEIRNLSTISFNGD